MMLLGKKPPNWEANALFQLPLINLHGDLSQLAALDPTDIPRTENS